MMPSVSTSRGPRWNGQSQGLAATVVIAVFVLVFWHGSDAAAQNAPFTRMRIAQINADEFRSPANGSTALGQQELDTKAQAPFLIITFPLSTPDSVADEVAAQYRIQPITRFVSSLLDRRVVLYRMPENGDAERLIAALRADARIANVQLNREYLALPRSVPPAPAVRGPTTRVPTQASVERRRPPQSARSEPGEISGARKPSGAGPKQAMADAIGASRMHERPPRRSAALGRELRWPTADEPFVGPTTR